MASAKMAEIGKAMIKRFAGFWRIEEGENRPHRCREMEAWDGDFMNLLGPANIIFDDDELGSFELGAVVALIDCRFSERDGKPFVEFSWQATNDTDDDSGRGWAMIASDGTLQGRIFVHRADERAFTATRF